MTLLDFCYSHDTVGFVLVGGCSLFVSNADFFKTLTLIEATLIAENEVHVHVHVHVNIFIFPLMMLPVWFIVYMVFIPVLSRVSTHPNL